MDAVLSFDIENDSFVNGGNKEIARTLEEAASKIRSGQTSFLIRDANGNKIGSFRIED